MEPFYGHFVDIELCGPSYKIFIQPTTRGYNVAQPNSNVIMESKQESYIQPNLAKPLKQKALATIMEKESDTYDDESDYEDELKPKEWLYIAVSAAFIVYVALLTIM
jgi:hypothetical protein